MAIDPKLIDKLLADYTKREGTSPANTAYEAAHTRAAVWNERCRRR